MSLFAVLEREVTRISKTVRRREGKKRLVGNYLGGTIESLRGGQGSGMESTMFHGSRGGLENMFGSVRGHQEDIILFIRGCCKVEILRVGE